MEDTAPAGRIFKKRRLLFEGMAGFGENACKRRLQTGGSRLASSGGIAVARNSNTCENSLTLLKTLNVHKIKNAMVVTLNELVPSVLQLPTFDKIRLIRILAENIEQPKEAAAAALLDPNRIYYVHTPQFADGTAAQLMQLLQESSPEN